MSIIKPINHNRLSNVTLGTICQPGGVAASSPSRLYPVRVIDSCAAARHNSYFVLICISAASMNKNQAVERRGPLQRAPEPFVPPPLLPLQQYLFSSRERSSAGC